MKHTGAAFTEVAVQGSDGSEETNNCCEKIDQHRYAINGTTIDLPLSVDAAAMLMNVFLVDAKTAQRQIADSGLSVVEIFPGKALMQLLAVDYQKNPLGDYNEAAIVFPVTLPGERKPLPVVGAMYRMMRGSLANFVYRMPVTQPFTTHAGRFIWGFPKWQADVDISFGKENASASFSDEKELVFAIQAASGGKITAKPQQAPSLAMREGKIWKTLGTTEGEGLRVKFGGEAPRIGETHPLALELRALGLPKKPLCTISMPSVRMHFSAAESRPVGSAFSS